MLAVTACAMQSSSRKQRITSLADVPDLPGCIATGASVEEVEAKIKTAIAFHLEGMREDGIKPPIPQSRVEYVEVAA
ncbi:type II toxin-antitoxin system HicB family antitoxin [Thiocapsa sp.]|uniref:type II toxin-antitoxin system HicB family antitoxin n=1 Tax=Thiocapsa sp. TaxID=2024551 RepID=UPI002CB91AF9|nr:type II toxin-antitoxin system HicB family antitoxin [Thiocapsa sp.]HSO81129.1 type II toxin-antitoxin system HicB family antitoxin [Thiocapsa sp.]